jgi:hypothetical protein
MVGFNNGVFGKKKIICILYFIGILRIVAEYLVERQLGQ